MGKNSKAVRKSGSRSRTGCLTCRIRHLKCDETKPTCVLCRKARLRCQQPDFIKTSVLGANAEPDPLFPSGSFQQKSQHSKGNPAAAVEEPEFTLIDCSLATSALDDILFRATGKPGHLTSSTETEHHGSELPLFLLDHETAYLLRTYATGIGVWADIFDSTQSYQQGVLTQVASSLVILKSTCALAARQLSLISSAQTWTPIAERLYGESLHLLQSALSNSTTNFEHALVATIMLGTYELLAFPGGDYHRHFRGAKSFIETLEANQSRDQLTRASFWIYARQEVGEAMNLKRPTMQDPFLWPKQEIVGDLASDVDALCNNAVTLAGKVVHFIFDTSLSRRAKKWTKQWTDLSLEWREWQEECPKVLFGSSYEHNGLHRFWLPNPSFAAAVCLYHVCQIFLLQNHPRNVSRITDPGGTLDNQVQFHANELIDLALSDMPDSVLVVVAQPLSHATRYVKDVKRREEAIGLLNDIQVRTGFHTRSLVSKIQQMNGRERSSKALDDHINIVES